MFRLVRAEPSDSMRKAVDDLDRDEVIDFTYYGGMTGWDLSVASGAGSRIWSAMLSASEPPTDAEIDELCRKMWPANWIPNPDGRGFLFDEFTDKLERDGDRKTVRRFIATL